MIRGNQGAILIALCAALAGASAVRYPLIAVVIVVGIVGLAAVARMSHGLASGLLLAALPFTRPFILSEASSQAGIVLALGAAVCALLDDSRKREHPRMRGSDISALVWTAALWVWVLITLSFRPAPVVDTFKSIISVVGLLAAALIVLRDEDRRRTVTRWALIGVVTSAALYCVTLAYWLVAGFGAGQIASLPLGIQSVNTPVAFPFTPLYAGQNFAGYTIPRFLGLGREAGVASVILSWAFFMLPRVGITRRRWRIVVFIGLFGTLSTAGFGLFIVAWVIARMIVHTGPPNGTAILKQTVGLGALAVALWAVFYAPFFGVEQKTARDPVSVAYRTDATKTGIIALVEAPFGREVTTKEAPALAINILASTVLIGTPGVMLSIISFVRPWMRSQEKALAAAPVGIIVANVLIAQPALQSTGYYILVALACWQPSRRDTPPPADTATAPASPAKPRPVRVG